jgi:hypothetical protein
MQFQALTVTTKQRVLLTGIVNIQDGLFQCHYHQCVVSAYLVDLHISTFLVNPLRPCHQMFTPILCNNKFTPPGRFLASTNANLTSDNPTIQTGWLPCKSYIAISIC